MTEATYLAHTHYQLYYQYFTTGFCGCFVLLNLFWSWTAGSPESLKTLSYSKVAEEKPEASDSSNLEITVTGNCSLCDLLQLGHFCCHNLSTNLKMIDCHSNVYSYVLNIQEKCYWRIAPPWRLHSVYEEDVDYNVIPLPGCFMLSSILLLEEEWGS